MPGLHPTAFSLVFDLGGSSLRAALIDAGGQVASATRCALAVPVDAMGISEADPATWWQGLIDAASTLARADAAAFGRVEAVAISAFTRSQVLVDKAGQVLRPAILWRDTRAAETLASLQARLPGNHPETREINPFHPLARLDWLQRHEPETMARARAVLEPKDYLNLCLTGRFACDMVASARLLAAACPHDGGSLFEAAGLDRAMLADALPPLGLCGRVQPGLPAPFDRLAGAAVATMANDTWASVIGLGAMQPGMAYNLSGTTEVFGVVSARPAVAPGLLAVPWGEGLHQLGGPSQTGGDTIRWLVETLQPDLAGQHSLADRLTNLLAGPRQPEPLLFLPYLLGERVPHWDPDLRGAFLGLNRLHGPADMAQAVLEGIACLNRTVLERAEAAIGKPVREIRFGGGGASNHRWQQIKADLCNRPVAVASSVDEGLLGAAIVAFTALARFPDLATAQTAFVRIGRRVEPQPALRNHHDRLYALFREAEQALAPISRQLARFP